MITLRQSKNQKAIPPARRGSIALALLLLSVPVIANAPHPRGSKSGSSQSFSRSSAPARASSPSPSTGSRVSASRPSTSSGSRVSAPMPSARSSSPVSASRPSTSSSSPVSASRPAISSSSRVASSPSVSQPGRVTRSSSPGSGTTSSSIVSRPSSSSGSKPASGSFSGRILANSGSSVTKSSTTSTRSQISQSKTSSIGSPISAEKPPVSTTPKSSTITSVNRIDQSKASRIGSPISAEKPSVSTTAKPSTRSSDGIGRAALPNKAGEAARTSEERSKTNRDRVGGPIAAVKNQDAVRSSRETVKGSDVLNKDGREDNKTRQQSALMSSSRSGLGRPSLFTRPESEKSLSTRPANERSQHIRSAKEDSRHTVRERRRMYAEPRTPELQRERLMAGENRMHRWRERSSNLRYRERNNVVNDIHEHEHVYIDYHDQICYTTILPAHRFVMYYDWGPYFTFRYFYPYYHRRFIFCGLGGYC